MAKTPEYLNFAEDGSSVDVELRREYVINGVKQKTVRMREPSVSDQIKASEMTGSDALREVRQIADLCDVAPDDIKAMGAPDYKRLQTAYLSFFD